MTISAKTTKDPAVQTSLDFLRDLLKHYGPRDFVVRAWDGTVWEPDAGQAARFTLVLQHPGAVRGRPQQLRESEALHRSGASLAGNAELLLLARDVAGRAASSSPERLGALGRERYDETHTPWPCGVPGGGEAPNLMLGTAGIGYSYLRLYDPARVPSAAPAAASQLRTAPHPTSRPVSARSDAASAAAALSRTASTTPSSPSRSRAPLVSVSEYVSVRRPVHVAT